MARPKSGKSAWLKFLQENHRPIYALDSQRRIVFANAALGQWLGVAAESLIGEPAVFAPIAGMPSGQPPLLSLAPPPGWRFDAASRAGVVCRWQAGSAPDARRAEFWPMAAPGEEPWLWVWVGEALSSPALDELAQQTNPVAPLGILLRSLLAAGERSPTGGPPCLVGVSPAARRLQIQFAAASRAECNALLIGPEGSGREELARSLVAARQELVPGTAPGLVPLHGRIADPEMVQVAIRDWGRSGRPPRGHLLLLDVDRLNPPAAQELLDLLKWGPASSRIVATSEQPLLELARQGAWSFELACLLSPLTLELSPLAERPEDVPLLASALLASGSATPFQPPSAFSEAAMQMLVEYTWPGNYEQLQQVVAAARESAQDELVQPGDLPRSIEMGLQAQHYPRKVSTEIDLDAYLQSIEEKLIRRALVQAQHNRAQAARLLGITRSRLLRRCEQLKIEFAEPEIEFIPDPEGIEGEDEKPGSNSEGAPS